MRVGEVEDQRCLELEQMGITPEAAAAWVAAQVLEGAEDEPGTDEQSEGGPLAVWPENWPVLTFFLQVQPQWRWQRNGHPGGLRWEAVLPLARELRLPRRAELTARLVEMEHEVMLAWED